MRVNWSLSMQGPLARTIPGGEGRHLRMPHPRGTVHDGESGLGGQAAIRRISPVQVNQLAALRVACQPGLQPRTSGCGPLAGRVRDASRQALGLPGNDSARRGRRLPANALSVQERPGGPAGTGASPAGAH
jgi:hypothetical protein